MSLWLTNKQPKTHRCVISTLVTNVLVQKHHDICIKSIDLIRIRLLQFRTKNITCVANNTTNENYILKKKWMSWFNVHHNHDITIINLIWGMIVSYVFCCIYGGLYSYLTKFRVITCMASLSAPKEQIKCGNCLRTRTKKKWNWCLV